MKKFFCVILGTSLLVACGSLPKEREVTVSDVSISGWLKNYVKVVDGTYQFTQNGDEAAISVKFELVEKPVVVSEASGWGSVDLAPLAENNRVINTGIFGFDISSDEKEKLNDLLDGEVGDTKVISFVYDYFSPDDEADKSIFTDAVSFEIIDKCYGEEREESAEEDAEDSESALEDDEVESAMTTNWGDVLDDYEEYIDQYIALYKKAQAGDMSAMSEYVSFLEKANNLSEQLSRAEGEMTAAQTSRFIRLQAKLANAALQ